MRPVSAVLPTIGRRDYLDIAISSLLEQNEPFAEVVVFDNSPQQDLQQTSRHGNDARVRWERAGRTLDAIDSWNTAIGRCHCEHVTVFGDDDVATADFHGQIQAVLRRSDFGLLPFECINEVGDLDGVVSGLYRDVSSCELRHLRIAGQVGMVVPGVVFSRQKFEQVGGFIDVGLPNYLYPDELLWLKLSSLQSTVAVGEATSWHYRRHRRSLGNLSTIRDFCGNVAPYVQLLRESLIALGVPDSEVFPPDCGAQHYIDRIQAAWFKSVMIRALKLRRLNPALYLREMFYYLRCEATLRGKLAGFSKLARHLAGHAFRRAIPLQVSV